MCDNCGAAILWSHQADVYATTAIIKANIFQINRVSIVCPIGTLMPVKLSLRKLICDGKVLFSFLTSSGHLKANNHLTFQNFAVDIPALITCGEMVVFSILFLFAYPIKLYVAKRDNASGIGAQYLGGILGIKALLAAFNIFDLLRAIWVAPLRLKSGRTLLEEEKVDYSSEEPSRLTQDVDVTYQ